MKKLSLVLLSVVLLICFAFTSCDFSEMMKEKPTTVPTTVKIEEDTTSEEENVDDIDSGEKEENDTAGIDTNAVLKKIIKSDAFKSQVKKAKEKAKGLLKVKAEVDGSTLVYKYTYTNSYSDAKLKSLKKNINSKKIKSTAKNIVQSMVKNGYNDFKVSFRYYTKEGKLIKKFDFDKSVLK